MKRLQEYKTRALRRYQNNRRRALMRCALHSLAWIFFLAWGASYAASSKNFPVDLRSHTWIPFAFCALTIAWVVVSRVITPLVRAVLFSFWGALVVLTFAWGSQFEGVGSLATVGAMAMASTFLIVAISSSFVDMAHIFRGFAWSATVTLVVTAAAWYLSPSLASAGLDPWDPDSLVVAALIVLFVSYQIWNTWMYLGDNKHLTRVEDSCTFAVMAPWTETIDMFSAASDNTESYLK